MTTNRARYISRFFRLLGASCIVTGCFIVSLPFIPVVLPVQPLSAKPAVTATSTALAPLPTRIIIPKVNISVPLYAVPYTDDRWSIPTGGAAILTNPESVGARGQVIYGHNWKSVFSNLTNVTIGDVIATELPNKQRQLYTVTDIIITPATDRTALSKGTEQSITLYSCTGWLDRDRVVVTAQPL